MSHDVLARVKVNYIDIILTIYIVTIQIGRKKIGKLWDGFTFCFAHTL